MAPVTSATRAFGVLAAALLLASGGNNNGNSLFARATTADSSTTGGAPDAGTASSDFSYTDCGKETVPPTLGGENTPAPTVSVRCLPFSSYTTDDGSAAPSPSTTTVDEDIAPTPSAVETPEPTLVDDSAVPADDDDAAPPADGDGDREIGGDVTPSPTAAATGEETAAGTGAAGEIPVTPAPTNEAGQTAEEAEAEGDTTDGAFGLAPPASGVALAASCGLLLAAGLLAL